MRVTLVNMPWASIDFPSLAIGILRTSLARARPDIQVTVVHANLEFIDWVTGNMDFSWSDYNHYSLRSYFHGHGDWVFSSALYDDPQWRNEEFRNKYGTAMKPGKLELNMRLHELAPAFIEHVGTLISDTEPDVVGYTSTFQQNVASLAAAKQMKRLAPRVLNVFGGANCDAEQGAALHRNFPFVDFVVRGEGELSFTQLLAAVQGDGEISTVEGLCWRDPEGGSRANDMSRRPLAPSEIAGPNYDGYFDRLSASQASSWVEPKLVVEGSRGCWWGEKHHCTFCGLNGSFMEFRGKSPERFYQEIVNLVERHKVLDIYATDNILEMAYLNSLLPRIAESGYDLRIQYEIKSNMRAAQVETLVRAGVVSVQPGVENLSSHVLKLMDKGVTGYHNVRLLRDAESSGMTVAWNYLYGFPGETAEDYDNLIEQFPALHHLYPPDGATRIAMERFSPHFNQPELGFVERRPADQYGLIYDLPESELMDLAYLFDTPPQGIHGEPVEHLDTAVGEWQRAYPDSSFTYCDVGSSIVLVSRRKHVEWRVMHLTDPVEIALFRLLDQPHAPHAAVRAMPADLPVTEEALNALLLRWRALGLVFEESGRFIQIATAANNQHVLHIRQVADTPQDTPDIAAENTRSEELATA
jgi:ribosomal peptide maturation radical SAM protein 1